MFSSEACDDFTIHYSFKVKCVKFVSGRFFWYASYFESVFMAKLAVDFDVNIALSNYGFNGVVAFANI